VVNTWGMLIGILFMGNDCALFFGACCAILGIAQGPGTDRKKKRLKEQLLIDFFLKMKQ
jgi:hypothetical protein